jgi:AraC family transcriptional regulator
VTDVGMMLGFSETSAFTSAFRRSVGFTPSDYRRRLM